MTSRKILFIIIGVSVMLLCMSACANSAEMPDDFNFTLNFGSGGGKNCIDTYNGTFTKDLIDDGTETIDFVIPADKIRGIYAAFVKYKVSALADDVSNPHPFMEPNYTYTLTYTSNEETRTIVCRNADFQKNNSLPDTHNRLVNFVKVVREYIYSTEEYQNMSPHSGGYD